MASPPVKPDELGEPESGFETALGLLEGNVQGVAGAVKVEIIKRIRALVDKNPEAFVKGMRMLLHEGRQDD